MSTKPSNDPLGGQPNQKPAGADLLGLDLSGVLPPGSWDALKPFLSNGLIAGGIYLFLIKPLKEKIDQQTTQISQLIEQLKDQEGDLEDLEERIETLEKNLSSVNDELDRKAGLFDTRRRDPSRAFGSSDTRRSASGNNGLTF